MPKHTPYPLVIVTWDDAWGKTEETVTADTVDQLHKPLPIKTTGYLLKEDDKGVSIANEYYAEEATYRGYTFIPRAMVKSVERGRFSKERKRPTKLRCGPEVPVSLQREQVGGDNPDDSAVKA